MFLAISMNTGFFEERSPTLFPGGNYLNDHKISSILRCMVMTTIKMTLMREKINFYCTSIDWLCSNDRA